MTKRKRRTIKEHGPHPTDVHVGDRVRTRRTMLGMSQTKLAESVGLTFQQVQKYESGKNRIGASRLYALSGVLGVPVSYFFEGLDDARSEGGEDTLAKRATLEFVRAYYRIKSDKVRKRLFELTKSIGKAGDAE